MGMTDKQAAMFIKAIIQILEDNEVNEEVVAKIEKLSEAFDNKK